MQIQTTTPPAQVTRTAPAAPAAAAGSAQPSGAGGPSPASIANRMVAAPEALPLTAIPTDWVPMGSSQRRVDTRAGLIVLERGNVNVTRTQNSITVRQLDNPDLAGITLRSDPRDPRAMTAVTAVGTFQGRLSGGGNEYEFETNDGRRSIAIERRGDRVRFETEGFGLIDAGHLNVYDR